MMLYDLKNRLYYKVYNCGAPKLMDSSQGRTWGYVLKNVNGERIKFWIEYSRGRYMYFQFRDKWYRVRYLQSNYRKKDHDLFKGVMVDLITDGYMLKLVKGNIEKKLAPAI